MSVPRDFGSNANKSWMSLSTCFRPFFGGTNNSTISENSSSPTLSLFWTALKASTAQISAAASRLKRVADPKDSEAETSTASSTVCSRSSRSEEHTSELQSRGHLVCRLLLDRHKRRRR